MFAKTTQKLLFVADIAAVNLTFLAVMILHYEGSIPAEVLEVFTQTFVIVTIGKLAVFRYFGLYSSLWEYASIEELIKVVGAVLAANILGTIYLWSMNLSIYPGVYLSLVVFEIAVIGGNRFGYRVYRRIRQQQPLTRQKGVKKTLIIGSGATASLIAAEMKNHMNSYGEVVGFIDDNEEKYRKIIAGTKVLGNRYDIYSVAKRYYVNEIIVALPTATSADMKEILAECKRSDAKVRIMPGVREMIDGKVSLSKIRDVEIEDLLGRDEVHLNVKQISSYIEKKTILITGGGGSIGSEICRQVAKYHPKKLVLLDIYENNAYDIQTELKMIYGHELNLDVLIASVRDRQCIFDIVEEVGPDVIFHAAAHKHVPLMERSPREAIKNNVFGTRNVAEAADRFGVDRFVLISTDKAVNPTNVMGASKRICEMIIQGLARQSNTKFNAVRFGNVLGSNGSVIPLFKKEIEAGGPVTVTHREIIRYFMTIPEAAQLVIQSGAIARGGEVFVLDMGEPVKIYDLAHDLIKLSGLKPEEDIHIEITGLRPGEKLYEELLMAEEDLEVTEANKIYICKPWEVEYSVLLKSIERLDETVISGAESELLELLKHIVPSFRDSKEVNQHISTDQENVYDLDIKQNG